MSWFCGIALCSQSSGGCVAISGAQATVSAGTTSITSGLSGTANAGSYCFIVFDVGKSRIFKRRLHP